MMWNQRPSGGTILGQKIGSFRIESWLGAGSLGIVYRGVKETTGEPVAIKVARHARESASDRLLHSGKILRQLRHQNIVRFLGMGRFAGAAYLAMDYIPGLTIANVIAQRSALPWPEVVGLGLQICEALHHIHKCEVLHRNLKPSHLILDPSGRLKLVGFGLAKSLDATALVTEGLAAGTPGYMAPEQICGIRAIDNRTDLYALGVVLWNLLTGEGPYQEQSDYARRRGGAALAFIHLTQPPPRPSSRIGEIPNALDDLVIQLMDHVPQKRPRDAAAVASVLSKLQD